jgi:hypothetical protein
MPHVSGEDCSNDANEGYQKKVHQAKTGLYSWKYFRQSLKGIESRTVREDGLMEGSIIIVDHVWHDDGYLTKRGMHLLLKRGTEWAELQEDGYSEGEEKEVVVGGE